MKKYLVEAIGTFFLVLTIPLAITYAADLAPLAIGAILMVMIYAGGHISGAHFNPAVSIAIRVRGKLSLHDLFRYRVAQCVGATIASFAALYLLWGTLAVVELAGSFWQILFAEFLFTFALAWVVLHTATDAETSGNSFYGLAIWFTVLAGAYTVWAISWWAFNPAVTLGWSLVGIFSWSTLRLHILGQLVGAFCAGQAYLKVV